MIHDDIAVRLTHDSVMVRLDAIKKVCVCVCKYVCQAMNLFAAALSPCDDFQAPAHIPGLFQ